MEGLAPVIRVKKAAAPSIIAYLVFFIAGDAPAIRKILPARRYIIPRWSPESASRCEAPALRKRVTVARGRELRSPLRKAFRRAPVTSLGKDRVSIKALNPAAEADTKAGIAAASAHPRERDEKAKKPAKRKAAKTSVVRALRKKNISGRDTAASAEKPASAYAAGPFREMRAPAPAPSAKKTDVFSMQRLLLCCDIFIIFASHHV